MGSIIIFYCFAGLAKWGISEIVAAKDRQRKRKRGRKGRRKVGREIERFG